MLNRQKEKVIESLGSLPRAELREQIGFCERHPGVRLQVRLDNGNKLAIYFCPKCEDDHNRRSDPSGKDMAVPVGDR